MDFFSKIFKSKSGSVIGIDIGSSVLKIVQIKKNKGSAVLETYGALKLGLYANKELGRSVVLKEEDSIKALVTLREAIESNATIAGFSIPFRSSFINLIDVPAVSDQKLAQIIPFEVRKYVSIPMEEISLDWSVIPDILVENENSFDDSSETENIQPKKRKVLFVATHNKEIKKYKKIAKGLEVETKFFESETTSTWRSITTTNRTPILIIDIGANSTKFYVMEHGVILRSLTIRQGGETLTEIISHEKDIKFEKAEQVKIEFGLDIKSESTLKAMKNVLVEIFTEANHIISDFESKYKKTISNAIFTGGGSTMKGLVSMSKEYIQKPTELADPFSSLKYPTSMDATLRDSGAEFTVAIGVALRLLEH